MNLNLSDRFEGYLRSIPIPHQPASLYKPIHYTLAAGGKRIRPQLVLAASGVYGGDPDQAMPAAAAVELLHNFTLIHDDIMDNADTRRGRPTVFRKWGLSEAILSGDVLFNIAWRMLLPYTKTRPPHVAAAIFEEFDRAVTVVCEGQAEDLEMASVREAGAEAYLRMIYAKTASLLEASLKIGALTAGANASECARMASIGREAGIAFQIQDDLLDAMPQNEKFGKRQGGDIREGKKTLLWIRLMEAIPQGEKHAFERKLERARTHEQDVAGIIDAYRAFGIFEKVQREADTHYRTAIELLEGAPKNQYSAYLQQLFEKLLQRDA